MKSLPKILHVALVTIATIAVSSTTAVAAPASYEPTGPCYQYSFGEVCTESSVNTSGQYGIDGIVYNNRQQNVTGHLIVANDNNGNVVKRCDKRTVKPGKSYQCSRTLGRHHHQYHSVFIRADGHRFVGPTVTA